MKSSQTKVVVFGLQDFASLAHFYLREDSDLEVVGFTVHDEYLDRDKFEGLPVTPFETLNERYSQSDVTLFAPMAPNRANEDRLGIFEDGRKAGWSFASYVSSKATTFSDFSAGENCFILEDNTVQPFVQIGDNVMMWSGNHIGHHSIVADHVFIASHVVVSGHCELQSRCYLGVNSTLRDASRIGEGSIVAMGANVIADTAPYSVNIGNPAKATGADARDLKL